MKKILTVLAIVLTIATTAVDAEAAKRFGGGSSFGRSAPALNQAAPKAPGMNTPKANTAQQGQQAQRPAAAPAAAAKPASPWRGMLMGAAAALGIAGLMSALGLSESFAEGLMMVLMAVAAFFVIRMILGMFLAKRMAAAGASAGAAGSAFESRNNSYAQAQPQPQQYTQPQQSAADIFGQQSSAPPASTGSVMDIFSGNSSVSEAASALEIPAGFDVAGFEKVAKENFVKMQKAWDSGNVLEISDFTTQELFVTVTHQLRERGNVSQTSEIINLSCKLLGIQSTETEHVAVVEFDGAMKIGGEFEEVREHWVLVKDAAGKDGWLLAGIQQASQN